MANERIRQKAKANGVLLWELATRYGVTDSRFSRMLRKEFSKEEESRAMRYIDQIAKEKRAEATAS